MPRRRLPGAPVLIDRLDGPIHMHVAPADPPWADPPRAIVDWVVGMEGYAPFLIGPLERELGRTFAAGAHWEVVDVFIERQARNGNEDLVEVRLRCREFDAYAELCCLVGGGRVALIRGGNYDDVRVFLMRQGYLEWGVNPVRRPALQMHHEAVERAASLFRSILTPEQNTQWDKYTRVLQRGASGRTYLLRYAVEWAIADVTDLLAGYPDEDSFLQAMADGYITEISGSASSPDAVVYHCVIGTHDGQHGNYTSAPVEDHLATLILCVRDAEREADLRVAGRFDGQTRPQWLYEPVGPI